MKASSQASVSSGKAGSTLVIMAKAPKPGMVKTRLAQSLPVAAVTDLYRCLLRDTIELAQSLAGVQVAIVCPAADVEALERFSGNDVHVVAQSGEGLAAGLTSAFAHFAAKGQQHIIAFNSDSPHLPKSVLEGAFAALATHDLVVGPTHDGGYYLVGAKACHPALFSGDGMGTASALEALMSRGRTLNLSMHLTDLFYDVDVSADLTRLAAELRFAAARAPRTAAWLLEWEQEVANQQSSIGGGL
jgi:uncharacterized protein